MLDVFEEEAILERAGVVGDVIRERMLGWQAHHPRIGDVRGLGAMLAIELVAGSRDEGACAGACGGGDRRRVRARLILLKAGVYGNCIRVLCPLTITDAELDEALAAWESALHAVLAA